jgi:hypothetical protein
LAETLRVDGLPGETAQEAMARILLQPTVRAAQTLIELGTVKDTEGAEFSLNALVAALDMQVRLTNKGDLSRAEALLVAQAHTLDAIYHKLVNRAVMNVGTHLDAAEAYMKLALRAQSHCRATLQALAVMKNPSPVAFVGQANIANGPQQVNNAPAVAAKGSRAGQSENPPNKLLEKQPNEWMDGATAITSVPADQELDAVGAINGAKNRRR